MKKLIIFLTIFGVCGPLSAQATPHTIKMVTFFPVPYMAYQNMSAQTLKVGIGNVKSSFVQTGDFNSEATTVGAGDTLSLWPSSAENIPSLNTTSISANGTGTAIYVPGTLTVDDLSSGEISLATRAVENRDLGGGTIVLTDLALGGESFPPCPDNSGNSGTIKWRELTLQDTKEEAWYLVCEENKAPGSGNFKTETVPYGAGAYRRDYSYTDTDDTWTPGTAYIWHWQISQVNPSESVPVSDSMPSSQACQQYCVEHSGKTKVFPATSAPVRQDAFCVESDPNEEFYIAQSVWENNQCKQCTYTLYRYSCQKTALTE